LLAQDGGYLPPTLQACKIHLCAYTHQQSKNHLKKIEVETATHHKLIEIWPGKTLSHCRVRLDEQSDVRKVGTDTPWSVLLDGRVHVYNAFLLRNPLSGNAYIEVSISVGHTSSQFQFIFSSYLELNGIFFGKYQFFQTTCICLQIAVFLVFLLFIRTLSSRAFSN
jgi:hypothetical protein